MGMNFHLGSVDAKSIVNELQKMVFQDEIMASMALTKWFSKHKLMSCVLPAFVILFAV